MLFCCIGIYSIGNTADMVYLTAVFGLVGYVLHKLDFEPAPLALGFVLGRLLEEKLRQALIISGGDPLVFVQSPLSAGLLLVGLTALAASLLPGLRARREEVFKE